jgi:EmrB/QacA subfamily drug resistance transporter
VLHAGLIGFGITSILCAIAPDSTFLVIARMLQGIAGALLVPSSLAMIISTFSGKEQGKAIGTWTAWTGISFIIGPLLGGVLVDSVSWRGIFAINVLPIAVTLFLLNKITQAERTDSKVKIDTPGALLCTVGLGAPVYALIQQPTYGWGDVMVWLPLVLGTLVLALFIWWERTNKQAMLSLSIFRRRNFSVGNIATAAIYGALAIGIFLITIYLQQVVGYKALTAGLALLPVTMVMFVLSPRFGALASKFGPRLFMSLGPLIAAGGFLFMLRFQPHVSYWTHLFPGVLLFALGLSCTVAPLTSAILGDVDTKHAGVASAVNNAVSRIAGLITIATIGVVTGSQIDTDGFHRALILTAVLLLIGSVISAIGIQNTTKKAEV